MTIAPSDAAVAARSFPRRWRGLFATATGDDGAGDVLERSGAAQLAERAVATLSDIGRSIPALVPRATPTGGEVLDRLDSTATELADAIESVPAEAWEGQPIESLTTGIEEAAGLLRQAERAVEAARATR